MGGLDAVIALAFLQMRHFLHLLVALLFRHCYSGDVAVLADLRNLVRLQ
jgi:hypothetical protein